MNEKQPTNAERIKWSRTAEEATGVPASRWRQQLREAGREMRRQSPLTGDNTPPRHPKITVQETPPEVQKQTNEAIEGDRRFPPGALPLGSGAFDTLRPFLLVKLSDTSIRVVAGEVNNELPSGFSLGDNPIFSLTVSGDGVVYIELEIDPTDGSTVSLSVSSAGSLPPDSAPTYYKLIGTFSTSGGALSVSTTIGGSQQHELCGGVESLFGLV